MPNKNWIRVANRRYIQQDAEEQWRLETLRPSGMRLSLLSWLLLVLIRHKASCSTEKVPLVKPMFLVMTRMPGDSFVVNSGLCCCVPCYLRDACSAPLVPFARRLYNESLCTLHRLLIPPYTATATQVYCISKQL